MTIADTTWGPDSDGNFVLPVCTACSSAIWPPIDRCESCSSTKWASRQVLADATLFSWVTVHHTDLPEFKSRVPYTVGILELIDTSARVYGLITAKPSTLSIGQKFSITTRGADHIWEPR
jgi:hypothetical protein